MLFQVLMGSNTKVYAIKNKSILSEDKVDLMPERPKLYSTLKASEKPEYIMLLMTN